MNYALIKKTDIANGPGVRVSLFVSGCTHHCKECFNQETWDFQYGNLFDDSVMQELLKAIEPSYIAGFSLLGGDPFEKANRNTVLEILKKIKSAFPKKSIWCYTGYDFNNDIMKWLHKEDNTVRDMLTYIDVLVDGEFIAERKNLNLRFRGSDNQKIIDVQQTMNSGQIIELDVSAMLI